MLERRWNKIGSDMRSALKLLGDEAWTKAKKASVAPIHPANLRSLLIGTTTKGMWDLRIGEGSSIVYEVGDKIAVAGDDSSPALFFAERYYSRELSVENLLPLAAHIILMGAHFADYVRGLEIVICKDAHIVMHHQDDETLSLISRNSSKLDEQVRNALTRFQLD